MSERKWTKGPWGIGDLDKHGQRIVRNQHIELCTCWHHSVGAIEKEMEANARLMAAAPDLFDALEDLAYQAEHDRKLNEEEEPGGWWSIKTLEAIHKARAALAKAAPQTSEEG